MLSFSFSSLFLIFFEGTPIESVLFGQENRPLTLARSQQNLLLLLLQQQQIGN
jgi:hypothetical protein